ncbi:MAG: hypothetical protein ACPG8W_01650 [Candidatus Promineifilaceae bacterium]
MAEDKQQKKRPAFLLLKANYEDRIQITSDRWMLLVSTFKNVPDDTLTQAAMRHMLGENKHHFPNIGDLSDCIRFLSEATPS